MEFGTLRWNGEENLSAYCLFCRAGGEARVAATLNRQYEDLLALPVLQEKHRSVKGIRSLAQEVMLPGYVFVYSTGAISLDQIAGSARAIRFLKDTDGRHELQGGDLEYAKWVLRYRGLIRCSKAMRAGARVTVTEGPLKDYEGQIKEISKKNRNGRVEIAFMGRVLSVWLPFEWVEEPL